MPLKSCSDMCSIGSAHVPLCLIAMSKKRLAAATSRRSLNNKSNASSASCKIFIHHVTEDSIRAAIRQQRVRELNQVHAAVSKSMVHFLYYASKGIVVRYCKM